jgi:hypothetical protein
MGVLSVLAVAACASGPFASRSSSDIVREKAQARWDLLVKENFAGAYEFISPAGRSVVSREAFATSMKPGFWKGAKVLKVECSTAEVCEVDVLIDYTYSGRKFSSPLSEKWVRQDSDWWYLWQR